MKKRIRIVTIALVLATLFAVLPLGQGALAAVTSDGVFMNYLYNYLLDRPMSYEDMDDWFFPAGILPMDWSEAARIVVTSEEFQSKTMTDTEYVTRLYRALLRREPDSSGLIYWTSAVSVYGRLGVFDFFVTCDEFRNLGGYKGP